MTCTPMQFRIADTFTDSLGRLTNDEQKAVKTTALGLQMNPAHPGLSFHKLDKAKDRNFCSDTSTADEGGELSSSRDCITFTYLHGYDHAKTPRLHGQGAGPSECGIRDLEKRSGA